MAGEGWRVAEGGRFPQYIYSWLPLTPGYVVLLERILQAGRSSVIEHAGAAVDAQGMHSD